MTDPFSHDANNAALGQQRRPMVCPRGADVLLVMTNFHYALSVEDALRLAAELGACARNIELCGFGLICGFDPATAPEFMQRLHERGLVDPVNGRGWILTARGLEVARSIWRRRNPEPAVPAGSLANQQRQPHGPTPLERYGPAAPGPPAVPLAGLISPASAAAAHRQFKTVGNQVDPRPTLPTPAPPDREPWSESER